MNKLDFIYGVILGFLFGILGVYFFIEYFSEYHFQDGFAILKANGSLGKLIAIGSVLNLALFFVLLQFQKDLMARGVVLATFILAIITIFL